MTILADFSPALDAFLKAVDADKNLYATFNNLFDDGDEAAIIAQAIQIGAPITVDDLRLLVDIRREHNVAATGDHQQGDDVLSENALDDVAGGCGVCGLPVQTDLKYDPRMNDLRIPSQPVDLWAGRRR